MMNEQDAAVHYNNIYPSPLHVPPSLSAPVSPALTVTTPTSSLAPMHVPGFFDNNLSRANSLSRIGSDLPPLASLTPSLALTPLARTPSVTPYPPSTPTTQQQTPSSRHCRPPPINTNFPHTPLSHPSLPSPRPPTVYGPPVPEMGQIREVSLMKWRTGHAFFIAGAVLALLGLCIGLVTSATTTCKVPYMAYSYYDNYVPYANMECTTHPSGWYAGAPILAIGLMCIGSSLYFSWVKVQEMKMAAKYQVAMV